jgi:dihydrofolate synthase/folylpolyglutamate synthase
LEIPEAAIYEGLESARWSARFEIIKRDPLVIFDGAHNPQGIDASVQSIRHYFGDKKICVLTGVLRDKDHAYIADRLSTVADRAFVITPDNPRALGASEYAAELCEKGVKATPCESIGKAYELAVKAAKEYDSAVVCLGSLYTYSELMPIVESFESEEDSDEA